MMSVQPAEGDYGCQHANHAPCHIEEPGDSGDVIVTNAIEQTVVLATVFDELVQVAHQIRHDVHAQQAQKRHQIDADVLPHQVSIDDCHDTLQHTSQRPPQRLHAKLDPVAILDAKAQANCVSMDFDAFVREAVFARNVQHSLF